jgi:DNA repair protein RadC
MQLPLSPDLAKPPPTSHAYHPKEFKVVSLRDCPTNWDSPLCDNPERAADYWQTHIATHPYFNPECECFVALYLNTRRRLKGHSLITIGTMDTIMIHPREAFRTAIVMSSSALIFMHNHPSGDPSPSEADVKVTRDFIRAGQLLKIDVLDHVIVGRQTPERPRAWTSLRELGHFYS